MASALGGSAAEAIQRLKKRYDGYHFSENCPGLFNPLSLRRSLSEKKLKSYCFETATPFVVSTEQKSAAGKYDIIIEAKSTAYIMKFNLNSSPDEALRQIDDRGYAIQYEAGGKKIYKIGINIDGKTRTLGEWKVKVEQKQTREQEEC